MSHENVLPPAVKKQVDQANAIIEQMKAQENPEGQPQETPAEPPKQEGASAQEPAKTPASPTPEKQQTPTEEPKAERTDWKHKFSVLQGKYDAEVPRLHDEIRGYKGTINELRDSINSLTATVETLKAVQKEPPKPAEPLVSQDEIDQFGPDLIDVVERVARQAVAPYIDKKFGEVQKTVKQVDENVASTKKSMAESARERLYERLDSKVDGWETINKDPKFLAWLKTFANDYDEEPRGVKLRRAFENNDADRVVKIFKSFQAEHVVENTDPGSVAPETPAPKEETQEPQQKLEELVAPGTPKTGSTDAPSESNKRIWNQADIEALYAEKNEFIRKRPGQPLPEKLVELEKDLFAAQAEGRIR